jgi:hypothetical protein
MRFCIGVVFLYYLIEALIFTAEMNKVLNNALLYSVRRTWHRFLGKSTAVLLDRELERVGQVTQVV